MKMILGILVCGLPMLLPGLAFSAQTGFSYDAGLAYATHDKDSNDDSTWGPTIGVNYHFNQNIGVGLDTFTDGLRWPYLLNASFIYTFANESAFSPYAFAGLGRQWEHTPQWTAHLGGGLEYTLTAWPSIFVDGRYVLAQENSYGLLRFGVRLRF